MSPLPPPGYYTDPTGQVRWWDGAQWAPVPVGAPAQPGNQRTMALVAHLGGLFGGWLTPLVVYLVDGGRDRYVRHNASEGLNFQLTVQLASLVVLLPVFVLVWLPLVAAGSGSPAAGGAAFGGFFSAFFLIWGFAMLLGVLNIVWSIMGMVKANRGEWWQYPVRIRFVKGYVPVEERYPVL